MKSWLIASSLALLAIGLGAWASRKRDDRNPLIDGFGAQLDALTGEDARRRAALAATTTDPRVWGDTE